MTVSPLDIALGLIVTFIVLIAIGQIISSGKKKSVIKIFKKHGITHLLICQDSETKTRWINELDRVKYPNAKIISLDPVEFNDNYEQYKHLEAVVQKYGVMRYPCMLSYLDGALHARHFTKN
jgi:hypothetical protein